jgi:hypothetical protein
MKYAPCPERDSDSDLENPGFEFADRIHDWRNYVGKNVREIWHTLTNDQRRAMALDADEFASREVWE